MKTYMIGYDLIKAGQNYSSLITAIKESGTWWHCLDSTWLVRSSLTAVQIRDQLLEHIDSNDRLLVAGLIQQDWAAFGFSKECSDWLHANA